MSKAVMLFQSTHPLRGATLTPGLHTPPLLFQSTHPLRGATKFIPFSVCLRIISIHAPLAGCDTLPVAWYNRDCKFQSTHPLRGATINADTL